MIIHKSISVKQGLFYLSIFFLFLLTILFVFLPIVYTFFVLIQKASIDIIGSFFDSRLFSVSCFTIFQAFCSSFFATLLGLLLSYFCAKKEFKFRTFLLSLAAIPVSVPALIMALSYVFFFGNSGLLNSLVQLVLNNADIRVSNFLYSFFAVIIIHSFYNFPIALKTITGAWENIDSSLEDAAHLLTDNHFIIFRRIIFPSIFPAIISSFLIIFLYSFFSFLIILLFGGIGLTTLEVELYQVSRFLGFSLESAHIALIETSIASICVALYIFSKSKIYKNAIETQRLKERPRLTRLEYLVFIPLVSLVIFFLILPLLSLCLKSIFSFQFLDEATSYFEKIKYFFSFQISTWKNTIFSISTLKALFSTIIVGTITACISVASALCLEYLRFFLQVKNKNTHIVSILPFVSLIVSPLILGFSLKNIFFASSPLSIFILCIAQSVGAWTIADIQIQESYFRIPHSIINASLLLSKNYFDAFFRCVLPMLKPGIKTAFFFCFAISAGDASLPLVLKIPHFENLSLMIFRLAGTYRFSESAVVSVILICLVCSAFLFFDRGKKYEY